jgi:hypothetical protein
MKTDPPIEPERAQPADDDAAIRTLVTRLSRPHPSGGAVIERATILAEGAGANALLTWIAAHAGEPERAAPATSGRGLHSPRHNSPETGSGAPLRYVLPPGALA